MKGNREHDSLEVTTTEVADLLNELYEAEHNARRYETIIKYQIVALAVVAVLSVILRVLQ